MGIIIHSLIHSFIHRRCPCSLLLWAIVMTMMMITFSFSLIPPILFSFSPLLCSPSPLARCMHALAVGQEHKGLTSSAGPAGEWCAWWGTTITLRALRCTALTDGNDNGDADDGLIGMAATAMP